MYTTNIHFQKSITEGCVHEDWKTATVTPLYKKHGFIKNKSTTTNLIEALNVWTEASHHKKPVDVIYLDYPKTFVTAPH